AGSDAAARGPARTARRTARLARGDSTSWGRITGPAHDGRTPGAGFQHDPGAADADCLRLERRARAPARPLWPAQVRAGRPAGAAPHRKRRAAGYGVLERRGSARRLGPTLSQPRAASAPRGASRLRLLRLARRPASTWAARRNPGRLDGRVR